MNEHVYCPSGHLESPEIAWLRAVADPKNFYRDYVREYAKRLLERLAVETESPRMQEARALIDMMSSAHFSPAIIARVQNWLDGSPEKTAEDVPPIALENVT